MNPTKTEFVHFYLAELKPAVKRKVVVGKVYRGDEQWRSNKTLGSLMCPIKDLKNRIFLGNVAFSKFANVWMKSKISVDKKSKSTKHKLSLFYCTIVTRGQYHKLR